MHTPVTPYVCIAETYLMKLGPSMILQGIIICIFRYYYTDSLKQHILQIDLYTHYVTSTFIYT